MIEQELNKPEYAGLTSVECLNLLHSKTVPTLGSIKGVGLKHLQVFISKSNLRNRLDNVTEVQSAVAGAIREAIQPAYLAAAETYSINLADPIVYSLLMGAVQVGLLTEAEKSELEQIATFDERPFKNTSLYDVIMLREPEKISDGEFTEIENFTGTTAVVRLSNTLPEMSSVRIEMRESHNGAEWTRWERVAHFYGVQQPGIYYQKITNNGLQRQLRWCGQQYAITGTVEVV